MNISGIFNTQALNSIYTNNRGLNVDTVSGATKTQKVQKPDAISSATISKGGDHYFEAKV